MTLGVGSSTNATADGLPQDGRPLFPLTRKSLVGGEGCPGYHDGDFNAHGGFGGGGGGCTAGGGGGGYTGQLKKYVL